jgi:hypothetical protein
MTMTGKKTMMTTNEMMMEGTMTTETAAVRS